MIAQIFEVVEVHINLCTGGFGSFLWHACDGPQCFIVIAC